ncbi:MAG: ABC transporter permease subunit [Candidatus Sumerlaeota bacterium]|nr:ABC transporter permease subunit [Candidatus Sumerlaeota bacterium]
MNKIRIIFKREIAGVFQNPGIYVVSGLLIFLLSSLVIYGIEDYQKRSSRDILRGEETLDYTQTMVGSSLGTVSILFVFIVPIITMRAFSEEKKSGLHELLATWPVTDMQVLLGKFFALCAVMFIVESIVAAYVIVYYYFGKPDSGVLCSALLGLILITFAYISFGLFASSVTENQIIAAIITFVGLFFFWVLHTLGGDGTGLFSRICEAISISNHYANFARGEILMTDIVYFIAFTLMWLFMSLRSMEIKRLIA